MSKSLGNAIFLSDDADTIKKKVMSMFTDPNHLRVEDPGNVEINPVFKYLDAFDPDQEGLADMKAHYARGGLGDVKVKRRLNDVLQAAIAPIRERREQFAADPEQVMQILKDGSAVARETAAKTLAALKDVLLINY